MHNKPWCCAFGTRLKWIKGQLPWISACRYVRTYSCKVSPIPSIWFVGMYILFTRELQNLPWHTYLDLITINWGFTTSRIYIDHNHVYPSVTLTEKKAKDRTVHLGFIDGKHHIIYNQNPYREKPVERNEESAIQNYTQGPTRILNINSSVQDLPDARIYIVEFSANFKKPKPSPATFSSHASPVSITSRQNAN